MKFHRLPASERAEFTLSFPSGACANMKMPATWTVCAWNCEPALHAPGTFCERVWRTQIAYH
jgi:hypothetical protein